MEHTMATKRPDSLEDFQRKQRDRLSPQRKAGDNYPGLPALSHEEATYVEAAREALVTIKRTFEFWMVIARGLKALKDKAQRIGGKATFDRLREREGLGGRNKAGLEILNKTRVSRLLSILDRIAEVEAWRAQLTDKERFTWASPEAVWRHATDADRKLLFRDAPKPSPRPARTDHDKKIAELEARNAELVEELASARADGKPATPKTTAAKPPFEVKEVSKNKTYRAYVDGNAYYEIELREGTDVALFGDGSSRDWQRWEVTKFVGKINCPYKPMPESKETPEKRKARSEVNTKARERTYVKALAIAQQDYERYR
jgi:hypothetical protein